MYKVTSRNKHPRRVQPRGGLLYVHPRNLHIKGSPVLLWGPSIFGGFLSAQEVIPMARLNGSSFFERLRTLIVRSLRFWCEPVKFVPGVGGDRISYNLIPLGMILTNPGDRRKSWKLLPKGCLQHVVPLTPHGELCVGFRPQ